MTTAESDLIESLQAPKGLLRVDAATPVILHLLMPMIKPFRLRYPEVTLSLISSESFINLIERKVDIAIRAWYPMLTEIGWRGNYLTKAIEQQPGAQRRVGQIAGANGNIHFPLNQVDKTL